MNAITTQSVKINHLITIDLNELNALFLFSKLLKNKTMWELVGLDGLEPSTPALSRRCSNQLSYRPVSAHCEFSFNE